MRPKIVAGNWKMNGSQAFVQDYFAGFKQSWNDKDLGKFTGLKVIIIPPAILIESSKRSTVNHGLQDYLEFAGQNVSSFTEGAFTGEVSAVMLKDFECSYSLVGHSERRALFGDDNQIINQKIKQLLDVGVRPILCVGETLEQREQGLAKETVQAQVEPVLSALSNEELKSLVLAYEPVWAIGTGKTATPDEAQEMHEFIREVVAKKSPSIAQQIVILYGGSVNAGNASSLFAKKDIDGALVGGASLKFDEFAEICELCGESDSK